MKRIIKKILRIESKNEQARVLWLKKALEDIPPGLRILDAGAGERQFKKFCTHLDYVSQDFGKYDGRGNTQGLQTEFWDNSDLDIVSDIAAIPEPNNSFDVIMCTEVFEHISNPIVVIQEFFRLLKPNGLLIITAPFCSLTHFAPYYFYTGFSQYFYKEHLTKAGFEILEISSNGNFFDYMKQEIARLPYVAKTYSKKMIFPWHRLIWGLAILSLWGFAKRGNASSELLTFGYHVRAVKKI